MQYNIKSANAMEQFGAKVASWLSQSSIIELVGDVGSGKTTLVRGLVRQLGSKETVQSPTFTLQRVYQLPSGNRFIHYDFYRLNDPGIMRDELAETISDDETIAVIEWADTVDNILPNKRIRITISAVSEDERLVRVSGVGNEE